MVSQTWLYLQVIGVSPGALQQPSRHCEELLQSREEWAFGLFSTDDGAWDLLECSGNLRVKESEYHRAVCSLPIRLVDNGCMAACHVVRHRIYTHQNSPPKPATSSCCPTPMALLAQFVNATLLYDFLVVG